MLLHVPQRLIQFLIEISLLKISTKNISVLHNISSNVMQEIMVKEMIFKVWSFLRLQIRRFTKKSLSLLLNYVLENPFTETQKFLFLLIFSKCDSFKVLKQTFVSAQILSIRFRVFICQ